MLALFSSTVEDLLFGKQVKKNIVARSILADYFYHVLPFCKLQTKHVLVQVCTALHVHVMQADDEFVLYYLLNIFTAPRNAKEKNVQDVKFYKAWHLYVPKSIQIVQNKCFLLSSMIMEQKNLKNGIFLHHVLNKVILEVGKHFEEAQAQDVLLCLMKYLPWNAKALINHKFAKVKAVALAGCKIEEAAQKNMITAIVQQEVVSNYEDYANCIIHGVKTDVTLGAYLSSKISMHNEQLLLCNLRVIHPVVGYTKVTTCKEDAVLYLLHRNNWKIIDKLIFNNVPFIKEAAVHFPHFLSLAPDSIQNDENIFKYLLHFGQYNALLHASRAIQEKYMMLFKKAVKNPSNKNFIVPKNEWSNDVAMMRYFIEADPYNIAYASDFLKNDLKLALLAVGIQPSSYTVLSDAMKQNRQVLRTTLQKSILVFADVPQFVRDMYPPLQQMEIEWKYCASHYGEMQAKKITVESRVMKYVDML